MPNRMKKQEESGTEAKVVQLFAAANNESVPPLSDEEVLQVRQFLREFAIIRATCPMALRALSDR